MIALYMLFLENIGPKTKQSIQATIKASTSAKTPDAKDALALEARRKIYQSHGASSATINQTRRLRDAAIQASLPEKYRK